MYFASFDLSKDFPRVSPGPQAPTLQNLKDAIKLKSDFQEFCDDEKFPELEEQELEFDPYDFSELMVFIENSPGLCQKFLDQMFQKQNQKKEIPSVIDLS